MPRDVVRYGIISTARIALNQHIPAARESANSEIMAISSRDEAKARQAVEEHGIPRHAVHHQASPVRYIETMLAGGHT